MTTLRIRRYMTPTRWTGFLLTLGLLLLALPTYRALGGNGAFTTSVGDHLFQQLALDPSNSRLAYAAGNDASHVAYVYKSFDGGATWAAANNGLGLMDVYAIAIARSNGQVIYVGGYNPTIHAAALYQTTTGGAVWNQVGVNLGDVSIQSLAFDPAMERTIFLGTNTGVYKSTDGGVTFSLLPGLGSRNVHALIADRTSPYTLFAGTEAQGESGVWKSSDAGVTWVQANSGLPAGVPVYVLAADASTQGVLFAGVATSPYSIYKSSNGGQAWALLGQTDTVYNINVDPLNGLNVYYATQNGVYRSANGGATFDLIFAHGGPVQVDAISPQTIYIGGQGISTYTSAPPSIIATITPGTTATATPAATATPRPCVLLQTPPGSGASYTFPQTKHTVSGIWLDFVKTHGDVDNLGYPRSEVVCDPQTGETVQYFQRVVLEFHPEQPAPYQLQRRLLVDTIYPAAPDPPVDPALPPPGDTFYFAPGAHGFGHFVANRLTSGVPTYFKQYYDGHGKEDTFGYPKEEPKLRTGKDGVQHWTQRFQAAVFEYHPENDVDGVNANGIPLRTYRVQLELVGDEYIDMTGLPPK